MPTARGAVGNSKLLSCESSGRDTTFALMIGNLDSHRILYVAFGNTPKSHGRRIRLTCLLFRLSRSSTIMDNSFSS